MAVPLALSLVSMFANSKKDPYQPFQYDVSSPASLMPTKKNAEAWDSEAGAYKPAAAAAPESSEKSEGDKDSDDPYKDKAAWVGAAVNLISDLERERQAKQAALQAQGNASATYGLNAMNTAGSALGRLNQGRMGRMGLGSMAGL